ncbi:MAG: hypothetical protein AVDCRST_MAG91-570 [uncultured Sphingomonadaceae bacterium]|uniref:Uncharacterized protein n=1 Tax=uncultured Sphingomonadaceae bacterium TaxID=169976 RepID=A0A6J4SDZ0_9SPHN|nr:MAG: hypothetical protein AVDCRST_MAG91-570 [uncultured Sphingomonadaceae bacterium]
MTSQQVESDMEAIFGRPPERPLAARPDSAVSPVLSHGPVKPARRFQGLLEKRSAAPVALGSLLVASLAAVLAATERSDISERRASPSLPATASQAVVVPRAVDPSPIVAAEIDLLVRTVSQPQGTTRPLSRRQQDGSPAALAQADAPAHTPEAVPTPIEIETGQPLSTARLEALSPIDGLEEAGAEPSDVVPVSSSEGTSEGTVRAFYDALGAGDGEKASAQVVAEKRSGAFSSEAISRFYGRLPEPMRVTGIEPLSGGAYRVKYRYSAGSSRCDGAAVVSLTRRNDREYIRAIKAESGC